jgi:hypothetical protein
VELTLFNAHRGIDEAALQSSENSKIPCSSAEFPCSCSEIPCSGAQGIWLKSPEIIGLVGAVMALGAPKLKNSLFFSLLAGNWDVETGSRMTASATTHSGAKSQAKKSATRGCGRPSHGTTFSGV